MIPRLKIFLRRSAGAGNLLVELFAERKKQIYRTRTTICNTSARDFGIGEEYNVLRELRDGLIPEMMRDMELQHLHNIKGKKKRAKK